MRTMDSSQLLRSALHGLQGAPSDLDPLIHLAGDAGFVLLGEATHGTHEFYATGAAITQRLIAEKGFQAVAVEADWPDAHRVNEYVRGRGKVMKRCSMRLASRVSWSRSRATSAFRTNSALS